MKSFLFESIFLLSRQSRTALTETFHPQKNLILGRNHTGKSSLIKNLFSTLGATPQGRLAGWDANIISVVGFRLDGISYKVVQRQRDRAIFDSAGELIGAAKSHKDWSALFAEATGFNLVLSDKASFTVPADPNCFFLPFFINQDGSWTKKWDTFPGIQQFRSPISPILEYFTGIKPPEYYEISSKRKQTEHALEDLQKERGFLEKARERVTKSISFTGPKIESENFQAEIALLTAEVTELNEKQEKLRDTAVRQRELLSSLQMQIRLSDEALKIFDEDSGYLRSPDAPKLVCPTCGAEHDNLFLEILKYADDARVLRELNERLRFNATEVSRTFSRTQNELDELGAHYNRVSGILDTRKGELDFRQVADSIGAESAFKAFEEERLALKKEMDGCGVVLRELDEQLKPLISRERSNKILSDFRGAYSSAQDKLNVPSLGAKRVGLCSRPDLSGSSGPRSVLAYYGAIWRTCLSRFGAFSMPLVIDSPNQQGQDDINLPLVLEFIATWLPRKAQIIVGTEITTTQPFDKTIELKEPYHLLQESQYDFVAEIVEPLVEKMNMAFTVLE